MYICLSTQYYCNVSNMTFIDHYLLVRLSLLRFGHTWVRIE